MSISSLPARFVSTLVGAGVVLGMCTGAQAQAVHKCQAEGRAVFQSMPCAVDADAPRRASPGVDAVVVSKKRTLADLLRERDGADRPHAEGRAFQGDGAHVLRARMGAV